MANNRAMVGQIQTHSFSAVLLYSRGTLEICKLCHHRKDVSDMILSVCVWRKADRKWFLYYCYDYGGIIMLRN